jgi:hypothetical protein
MPEDPIAVAVSILPYYLQISAENLEYPIFKLSLRMIGLRDAS